MLLARHFELFVRLPFGGLYPSRLAFRPRDFGELLRQVNRQCLGYSVHGFTTPEGETILDDSSLQMYGKPDVVLTPLLVK